MENDKTIFLIMKNICKQKSKKKHKLYKLFIQKINKY